MLTTNYVDYILCLCGYTPYRRTVGSAVLFLIKIHF